MAANYLSCQELVELVTDYLENALSPDDRARFEAHIGDCHSCTNYIEQIRQTIRVTGKLSEESLPDTTTKRLLAAFRDWKKSTPDE